MIYIHSILYKFIPNKFQDQLGVDCPNELLDLVTKEKNDSGNNVYIIVNTDTGYYTFDNIKPKHYDTQINNWPAVKETLNKYTFCDNIKDDILYILEKL